jgi:hypothetical protein
VVGGGLRRRKEIHGTDRLPKRRYLTTNLRSIASQKSEGLIYTAAEVVLLERYIAGYFECLTNTKAWPRIKKTKKFHCPLSENHPAIKLSISPKFLLMNRRNVLTKLVKLR